MVIWILIVIIFLVSGSALGISSYLLAEKENNPSTTTSISDELLQSSIGKYMFDHPISVDPKLDKLLINIPPLKE